MVMGDELGSGWSHLLDRYGQARATRWERSTVTGRLVLVLQGQLVALFEAALEAVQFCQLDLAGLDLAPQKLRHLAAQGTARARLGHAKQVADLIERQPKQLGPADELQPS